MTKRARPSDADTDNGAPPSKMLKGNKIWADDEKELVAKLSNQGLKPKIIILHFPGKTINQLNSLIQRLKNSGLIASSSNTKIKQEDDDDDIWNEEDFSDEIEYSEDVEENSTSSNNTTNIIHNTINNTTNTNTNPIPTDTTINISTELDIPVADVVESFEKIVVPRAEDKQSSHPIIHYKIEEELFITFFFKIWPDFVPTIEIQRRGLLVEWTSPTPSDELIRKCGIPVNHTPQFPEEKGLTFIPCPKPLCTDSSKVIRLEPDNTSWKILKIPLEDKTNKTIVKF
eukprot:TRINITY_DN1190_c0_g2_i1.p1 TRINITY_DN1190_c0_g2~~TRINITY_DN1190_c0_g2_i1.p1  ORF type:complete len:286 (-),score=57.12 TRINITY_DN1190_c0_g2_i1:29-886(-)